MNADFEGIGRILVRAVNWVGDTILTYPAVAKLKGLFPQSHLSILVQNHLADLWKNCPWVNEVIPFEQKNGMDGLSEDLRFASFLKKKRFDLAVIFPRSFRSAYPICLARVPIRLGYRGQWRLPLLTHAVRQTVDILKGHRIHYYYRLTDIFGTENIPIDSWSDAPRLFLREGDRNQAKDTLQKLGLVDGRPLIGINPGAAYGSAKCWPTDRFGELGRRLVRKRTGSVILFGKVTEKPMTENILRHIGEGGADLAGKTDLLQLAAVLEHCRLLVTNDTGTMHVAAAVGTPVIALFGPTDPGVTGPWGEGHTVVKQEVNCSPCLKRLCPTDHRCMKGITVDSVEQIINDRLRNARR